MASAAAVNKAYLAKAFGDVEQVPGVRVWRLVDFHLEPVAKKDAGQFFEGDSYLVLHTFKVDDETEALKRNIHFWLGKDTTQDESGSVALYATQLDDYFGGAPKQFREVQGKEGDEFKQLFPRLGYRSGGAASGFKHAADAPVMSATGGVAGVKMLQVKSPARGTMQVFEVPASADALGTGDVFVCEHVAGGTVYIWQGPGSNLREKMEAVKVAESLRGTAKPLKVVVLDTSNTGDEASQQFYRLLGARAPPQRVVDAAAAAAKAMQADQSPQGLTAAQAALDAVALKEHVPDASAAAAEELSAKPPRLFHLAKASGSPARSSGAGAGQWEEINGTLSKGRLNTEGQFGLVAGGSIWVWSGSKVLPSAVAAAVAAGGRLRSQLGLPDLIVVKAVKEKAEPGLFTMFFSDWEQ